MRKIIVGFLSIILVSVMTTATGYAAFTSQVNVNNVSFSTGTAALQVSLDNGANNDWSSSVDLKKVLLVQNAYPGYTSPTGDIWFKNNSTSPINLKLSAQLVSASSKTAWTALSPNVNLSINGVVHTLADWNTNPVDINLSLAPNQTFEVPVILSIPDTADNTISGQTLTTQWVVTGTQVAATP